MWACPYRLIVRLNEHKKRVVFRQPVSFKCFFIIGYSVFLLVFLFEPFLVK